MQESEAIKEYQFYKKKLKVSQSLSSYWVSDFEGSYDELVIYLRDLDCYIKALTPYVKSREFHYKTFIEGKSIEERGHKVWRENLNKILVDAEEKFKHFSNIEEKQFYEFEPFQFIPDIWVEDPDVEDVEDVKTPNMVKPPTLTKRDKNRRKRIRQKLKKEQIREENEILNKVTGKVQLGMRYKFSLDIEYITNIFMIENEVILINPDLYFDDEIEFTGNKDKIVYILKLMISQTVVISEEVDTGLFRKYMVYENENIITNQRNLFIEFLVKDKYIKKQIQDYCIDLFVDMENVYEKVDVSMVISPFLINANLLSYKLKKRDRKILMGSISVRRIENCDHYERLVIEMNYSVLENAKFSHQIQRKITNTIPGISVTKDIEERFSSDMIREENNNLKLKIEFIKTLVRDDYIKFIV